MCFALLWIIVGVIVVIIVVVVIVIVLFVVIVLLSSSLVCPTTWLIGRVSSRAEPLVSGAGTLAWYTLALLSLAWDAPSYMGRACCLPDC